MLFLNAFCNYFQEKICQLILNPVCNEGVKASWNDARNTWSRKFSHQSAAVFYIPPLFCANVLLQQFLMYTSDIGKNVFQVDLAKCINLIPYSFSWLLLTGTVIKYAIKYLRMYEDFDKIRLRESCFQFHSRITWHYQWKISLFILKILVAWCWNLVSFVRFLRFSYLNLIPAIQNSSQI